MPSGFRDGQVESRISSMHYNHERHGYECLMEALDTHHPCPRSRVSLDHDARSCATEPSRASTRVMAANSSGALMGFET